MRMWMVNPRLMCRKHLVGEHGEIHLAVWNLKHGTSMAGYLDGLLNFSRMRARHDRLAREMTRRGYRHASPLQRFGRGPRARTIDAAANLRELSRRCKDCRRRIREAGVL